MTINGQLRHILFRGATGFFGAPGIGRRKKGARTTSVHAPMILQ
jgi:hypothetical protein